MYCSLTVEGGWVAVIKEACQKILCLIDDSSFTSSREATLHTFQKNFLRKMEMESPQEKQPLF